MVMAMLKNRQIQGEGRPLLEALACVTTYASPEVRWSTERISAGEVLVRGRGQRGLNFYYSHPGQGDGVLCW